MFPRSDTDTGMLKLGTRPLSFISRNIFFHIFGTVCLQYILVDKKILAASSVRSLKNVSLFETMTNWIIRYSQKMQHNVTRRSFLETDPVLEQLRQVRGP
jgi:hypothetical protein